MKTLRGSGATPNFEAYRLAEREKSRKFAVCAAIRISRRVFTQVRRETGKE